MGDMVRRGRGREEKEEERNERREELWRMMR
jgi:hypothetical protein